MIFLDERSTDEDFRLFGGGKARHLARLSRAGLSIPPWFCIPSTALWDYLNYYPFQGNQLDESFFLKNPLHPALLSALTLSLREREWDRRDLAVRSSGMDEDSRDHSFAGQFSSFLFQNGVDAISESIRRAWASGFSERVKSYRKERGLHSHASGMGVVVQLMVDSDSSGVVFTRNPLDPMDRDHLLLDSVFGQGEGLVNGDLESDHFKLSRVDGKVVNHSISIKSSFYTRSKGGGIEKARLSEDQTQVPSLKDSEIQALVRGALEIEKVSEGVPQDIEWAIEKGQVYFLQTRPITSLPDSSFFEPQLKGESPTLWDNSNIIESYSGVTSPFTFSYASHAYQVVYRQFAEMMKVPHEIILEQEPRFRNMLGMIRGRIYYNLINWYQLLMVMPGSSSNSGFMETMMGVKKTLSREHQAIFNFVHSAPKYSLFFRLKLVILSIYRFMRSDAIIADFKFNFNRIYGAARKQNFREWPLDRLVAYYGYLQKELLPRWKAPILNDFLCMVFFGILKKLTSNWIDPEAEGASLQNDLLSGQGDLESTEPTKFLMRIAEKIDQGDSTFRDEFISISSREVWLKLESGSHPEIYSEFKGFLDRYGFRCVNELKFEERDLNDDPEFVVSTVASYIRMKAYSVQKIVERETRIREDSEARVRHRVRGIKRLVYFWVLKHARLAVKNREDLRFDRTKSYGLVRNLMRAVGFRLTCLGVIDSEFDIFYLTVDEILAYVEGRLPTHSPRDLIQVRKPIFNEYRKSPAPPDRFVTYGAVGVSTRFPSVLMAGDLLKSELKTSDDPSLLYGTPCSPGRVEGRVRVAHELKDTENLNGEILVTSRTDPGWVPLYPSCSGLLIERGSLLSHSAVVARELGLPTIVGISGGLMQKLKTGQRVRMDAGTGEVKIL